MNDGADQVASASAQVSSASQSLAEGASAQAASIEETSSSLEEMSSMTKQNAGNATEADNLMKEANHIVGNANDSMQDLTGSMEEITKASGIEQINLAVAAMDKIVQQNAASTEESASASEEMNAQAEHMKSSVNELVLVIQGGGENHSGVATKVRGIQTGQGNVQKSRVTGARPKCQVAPIGKGPRVLDDGRTKQVSPEQVIPMEEENFQDF